MTQADIASRLTTILETDFNVHYPELNHKYVSGYEHETRNVPNLVLLAYAQMANVYVEVLIDDRIALDLTRGLPYASKDAGVFMAKE